MNTQSYLVGVDEAGRGPLAGPVAVCATCVPSNFPWESFIAVNDSKKMTARARERVFAETVKAREEGVLDFHVELVPAEYIDKNGITNAVASGIRECFEVLDPDPTITEVKLDGLLQAPERFLSQETIIRGDATEKVISLASILAKVTRDHFMERLHDEFPHYHFANHKGYGTKLHYEAIGNYGLCREHRKTFLKNLHS